MTPRRAASGCDRRRSPVYREDIVGAVKERPDLELVGEAEDGRFVLDEIKRVGPDVALLDNRVP